MAPTGAAVLNATLDIPDGPLNATDALGQPAAQATLDVQSSTLAANAATAGSGIHNGSTQAAATAGVVTVTNSIVGGLSQINNCAGPVTSLGHNIDSGGTCGFGASGDIANEDPLLLPLTNNGGPTLTHALLPDSPAIDAADNAACPVADQRGEPRPSDGDGDGIAACDMGAYELEAPLPATPTPSPAPTPTPKVLPDSGGSASARAGASVEAFGVALVGAIAGGGGLVFLRRRAR